MTTTDNNDNLKSVAQTYGELKMQYKAIEKQLKALEGPLREALVDKGDVNIGNYVYTVKTFPGRKTVDKEALSAALSKHGLDLDAFMKVGAPFTTMSVKEIKTL